MKNEHFGHTGEENSVQNAHVQDHLTVIFGDDMDVRFHRAKHDVRLIPDTLTAANNSTCSGIRISLYGNEHILFHGGRASHSWHALTIPTTS
ncbi:hypothetical protein AVEN_153802-1 [Araneus ventricosus]|uniref:Uncharacterized protein n=1 Tax=Araneus ventricosus TaxID=182803 RepID=A0A4Y2SCI5_ARAVE|nr:hypothetical protein AVEN_153802-1 [Araneus ventricosus]